MIERNGIQYIQYLLSPWQRILCFGVALVCLFICVSFTFWLVYQYIIYHCFNPHSLTNATPYLSTVICDRWRWFVCLSVFLSVCLSFCSQCYSTSYERIAMTFYGGVHCGNMNKWLGSDSDPDHHAGCLVRNLAITGQIMSEFWWSFQDSSAMMQGRID